MELGQRIKQARLEAGLSQRQLCGEEITRNMLSQIENGSARPSMDTLRYFAARLGKSVSFFLEEDTVTSPNQRIMVSARESFAKGEYGSVRELLRQYHGPDAVFDPEKNLLESLCLTHLARNAINDGRIPFALQLLQDAEEAAKATVYDTQPSHRARQLLLARAIPERAGELLAALPPEDEELLLRAKAAMQQGKSDLAMTVLAAARNQSALEWILLSGEAAMAQGNYALALEHYRRVEESCPQQALPALERCCRELEDYKLAYYYACKQRESK